MKTLILILLSFNLLLPIGAFCIQSEQLEDIQKTLEQAKSFSHGPYFEVGGNFDLILLPVVGIGYRAHKDHHGVDCCLRVETDFDDFAFSGRCGYDYYFSKELKKQFYVGTGIGVHSVPHMHLLLGPDFVLGREYQKENGGFRFIQISVEFATTSVHKGSFRKIPLDHVILLTYGIGF